MIDQRRVPACDSQPCVTRAPGASSAGFEAHIAVESRIHDGKRCREYRAFDASARPLFTARALRAPGTIHVFSPDAAGGVKLLLKPRWTFPVTGKYEVRDVAGGRVIGIARRNGKLSDGHGRRVARFKDARSLRSYLGEGLAEAVFQAAVGSEGTAYTGPGSDTFVLLVEDRPAGSLRRGRLPFLVDPPATGPVAGWRQWVRKALPKSWLEPRLPAGWRLRIDAAAGGVDRDLLVAQALLTAEISAW